MKNLPDEKELFFYIPLSRKIVAYPPKLKAYSYITDSQQNMSFNVTIRYFTEFQFGWFVWQLLY